MSEFLQAHRSTPCGTLDETWKYLTRRQLIIGLAAAVPSLIAGSLQAEQTPTVANPRRGLLVQPRGLAELNMRSKIVLELEGTLQIEEPDPKKEERIRQADVKAISTQEYFEKIAFADDAIAAAARTYSMAKVENWISGSASSFELRPHCRETYLLPHDGTWQQYCEKESLTVREVELLHSPINTAVLELLLPREPAKPETTWELTAADAAALLNLEAVHRSTVTGKISKVEKGKATIEFAGKLDATANSVPTTLELEGNFHVSPASQCAVVTWLGLVLKEQREISQSEPGFSVTARIRLIREETPPTIAVTSKELRNLVNKPDEGQWLARLQSQHGNYSMLADRRWKTYIDGGEEAILRMIENNLVIAQCNITRLNAFEAGKQLTLEGLNSEIKQSLGSKFETFLESSERLTSQNLRLMRSVVVGQSDDVPIQWIYAHLADDQGHRSLMIFTMGGNVTDRFAAADEQMTDSFQLLPPPSAQEPTVAPQLSALPEGLAR